MSLLARSRHAKPVRIFSRGAEIELGTHGPLRDVAWSVGEWRKVASLSYCAERHEQNPELVSHPPSLRPVVSELDGGPEPLVLRAPD